MYDFVKSHKDNPSVINSRVRAEELRQSDLLFIKLGIEESDVEPSIEKLNLTEDDEYKQIMTESKEKSDSFLKEKAREGLKGH